VPSSTIAAFTNWGHLCEMWMLLCSNEGESGKAGGSRNAGLQYANGAKANSRFMVLAKSECYED
jgi:hypothetical protein